MRFHNVDAHVIKFISRWHILLSCSPTFIYQRQKRKRVPYIKRIIDRINKIFEREASASYSIRSTKDHKNSRFPKKYDVPTAYSVHKNRWVTWRRNGLVKRRRRPTTELSHNLAQQWDVNATVSITDTQEM